jgi:hypothetical protein
MCQAMKSNLLFLMMIANFGCIYFWMNQPRLVFLNQTDANVLHGGQIGPATCLNLKAVACPKGPDDTKRCSHKGGENHPLQPWENRIECDEDRGLDENDDPVFKGHVCPDTNKWYKVDETETSSHWHDELDQLVVHGFNSLDNHTYLCWEREKCSSECEKVNLSPGNGHIWVCKSNTDTREKLEYEGKKAPQDDTCPLEADPLFD